MLPMNVVIRADSSIAMGSGHVMRCLALADALRANGAEVFFICRELSENLCDYIEGKKYQVYRLQQAGKVCWLSPSAGIDPASKASERLMSDVEPPPKLARREGATQAPVIDWQLDAHETQSILKSVCNTIDWLIVDHYFLDSRWESQMRPYVQKIMVIDDLADRQHDCDLLLDQNFYENIEGRYEGLVTTNCFKLFGPQYALLRQEFREARKKLRERDGKIQRILISFGGADPTNETEKALKAIQLIQRPEIAVDVVVGAINPRKEEIEHLCSTFANTTYHCQVENMAELMMMADLAIGAGGSTIWEHCCLGLPAVIISVANNQYEVSATLARHGYQIFLGCANTIDGDDISTTLKQIVRSDSEKLLSTMSGKCLSLVDGQGTIKIARKLQLEEY